jgi:FKBP-type peptidyl-prolyl cis-trans isomerase FkpA
MATLKRALAARRRRSLFSTCSSAGLCLSLALSGAVAADKGFTTQDEELLYYWGTTFGEQVGAGGIRDPKEIELVTRGLRDGAAGKAPRYGEEYPSLLNNLLVQRSRTAAQAEAEAGREYARKMGEEPGAVVTQSGLVYRELAPGTKPLPGKPATVTVHYVGTLRDGTVFDSSRERGAPLETSLERVIPCWSEAIPKMKIGARAKITCPPELAYGERGNTRIPGGSALTFEVELISARE